MTRPRCSNAIVTSLRSIRSLFIRQYCKPYMHECVCPPKFRFVESIRSNRWQTSLTANFDLRPDFEYECVHAVSKTGYMNLFSSSFV